ncbi:Transposase IS66 family protein, partial [Azotobacter beijerinckii]
VIELGCLAHARRKFFELQQAGSPIAEEALRRIAELYALEAQAREWSVAARQQLRGEQAQPRLRALREWLIETRLSVAEGSGTAKAIDYSLKRWEAYSRYADSGHLPLGRVEMWRGSGRFGISVDRLFRLAVPYCPDPDSVSTSPSSNRTCGFPASGSLATHQAFAFERSRAGGTRRISPNFSYRYWSEYWRYPVPRLPLRRRNQILTRRAA